MSGLEPRAVVAAAAAAVAVAAAVGLVVRPRRRLGPLVRPYVQLARARLGTGPADPGVLGVGRAPASAVAEVLGPLARRAAEALAAVVDAGRSEGLALRLRRAGLVDLSAEQYRMRQLAWTAGGLAGGAAVGLALGLSAGGVLGFAAGLGFCGAVRWRSRLERATAARRALMRSQLYTVAQLLAVYVRTGHGPTEAVRAVVAGGRGPVVDELADALAQLGAGSPPGPVWDGLAGACAEPAAARLYRILASAARSGGDLSAALLAVAADLRAARRDELARAATRRRAGMLVPLLCCIAPVMLLFVGAAVPTVVLGR